MLPLHTGISQEYRSTYLDPSKKLQTLSSLRETMWYTSLMIPCCSSSVWGNIRNICKAPLALQFSFLFLKNQCSILASQKASPPYHWPLKTLKYGSHTPMKMISGVVSIYWTDTVFHTSYIAQKL